MVKKYLKSNGKKYLKNKKNKKINPPFTLPSSPTFQVTPRTPRSTPPPSIYTKQDLRNVNLHVTKF